MFKVRFFVNCPDRIDGGYENSIYVESKKKWKEIFKRWNEMTGKTNPVDFISIEEVPYINARLEL